MKILNALTIFLLVALQQGAFASAKVVGNGGDAVVCRDQNNSIKSVEIFDYFEARVLREIYVELPDSNSPENIAIEALNTLKHFSPIRAEKYEKLIREFSENMKLVPNLVDIPDSGHIAMPDGCGIEQLVVQQKPTFPEDKRFLVNNRLWPNMTDKQKAGMMLHEAFYTEALERSHDDSRKTRYFHSKMVSTDAKNMTDKEFSELVQLSDFLFFELKSIVGVKSERLIGLYEHKLIFTQDDGNLSEIKAYQQWREYFGLNNPLIDNFSDDYGSGTPYTENIYSIQFLNDHEELSSISKLKQNGYWRPIYMSLNGQLVSIEMESEIKTYKNGSLEVNIATEKCYIDPKTSIEFCGKVKLDLDGNVIEQSLMNFPLKYWSFKNASPDTKVLKNKDGFYQIYGDTQHLVATFTYSPLNLVFKDFSTAFIEAESLLPNLSSLEEKTQLDPNSTVQGQEIGEGVFLIKNWNRKSPTKNFIEISNIEYEKIMFTVRSTNALKLNMADKSFFTHVWHRWTIANYLNPPGTIFDSVYPIDSMEIDIQGKAFKSEPRYKVYFRNNQLYSFHNQKNAKPVTVKTEDWPGKTSVVIRGGHIVVLSNSGKGVSCSGVPGHGTRC